jgi:hypothetical protein
VRCYWEHVGNFGTCYEPIENALGTIKIHSPTHLLSSLGQNPQKSLNSQKISKNRRFPERQTPYRTNGLVVRKDGYRRDFFPNFLATVDNIRKPTVTDQGFLFFVFCGNQEFGVYFGKK